MVVLRRAFLILRNDHSRLQAARGVEPTYLPGFAEQPCKPAHTTRGIAVGGVEHSTHVT
mgnify:FL=1